MFLITSGRNPAVNGSGITSSPARTTPSVPARGLPSPNLVIQGRT